MRTRQTCFPHSAYHGHLTTTIDISPYKFQKINDGKKKNWVHVSPIPCSYRGKYTRDEYSDRQISQLYAQEVQKLINDAHKRDRKIAAFIHESMISCGGQVVLPDGYLDQVYRSVYSVVEHDVVDILCLLRSVREAGGVCIADEVQVGFGRVGSHMWAFQTYGENVIPDIVTIGKPIGNGHPVACVVTTQEISQSFENIGTEYFNTVSRISHISLLLSVRTCFSFAGKYGGNPVSLAIASAVLDVIEKEKLQDHANRVGKMLLTGLESMQLKYKFIGDVRGMGLFIGVDLVKSPLTKEAAAEIADYCVRRLKEERIIMSTEGKYGNVLKIKPPMVFTAANAQHLLSKLDHVFSEVDSFLVNHSTISSSGSAGWEDDSSSDSGDSFFAAL